MEKALEELSASTLRNLLIVEVKKFIICLDYNSTEELQVMKIHLKRILNLITEKEQAEGMPVAWGKNSTQTAMANLQSDSTNGTMSTVQSD